MVGFLPVPAKSTIAPGLSLVISESNEGCEIGGKGVVILGL